MNSIRNSRRPPTRIRHNSFSNSSRARARVRLRPLPSRALNFRRFRRKDLMTLCILSVESIISASSSARSSVNANAREADLIARPRKNKSDPRARARARTAAASLLVFVFVIATSFYLHFLSLFPVVILHASLRFSFSAFLSLSPAQRPEQRTRRSRGRSGGKSVFVPPEHISLARRQILKTRSSRFHLRLAAVWLAEQICIKRSARALLFPLGLEERLFTQIASSLNLPLEWLVAKRG